MAAGQTAPQTATEVEVVFLDGRQFTTSYPGTLRRLGRGSIGRSVDAELVGGCMQPNPDHAEAPAGLEPAAALRPAAHPPAHRGRRRFQVRTRAGVIGGGDLSAKPEAARQEAAARRRYLEDLAADQRPCEQRFPIPAELPAVERTALRMARLLIHGHCVISPYLPQGRFTLNDQDSPVLRALLSGEPHAVRGECDEFAIHSPGSAWTLAPCSSSTPASPPTTPSRPSPPSMPDAATARSSPCGPPTKSTSGSNGNPLPPATNPSPYRWHCPLPRIPLSSQGCRRERCAFR
ncbi:hypothetical protein [Streptomyces sp. WMMC940]|uniref:hypothetical protein n=1 Tax=Streptomyces sp. WMMC940 TaxID=3015153 RepID=UPI0022B5EB71|nr:hypothetical protein [Streptomyces sp. WMMC940]MCZ7456204.1 hypothetical protein [Streptomyces sp. WMMC940]